MFHILVLDDTKCYEVNDAVSLFIGELNSSISSCETLCGSISFPYYGFYNEDTCYCFIVFNGKNYLLKLSRWNL